MLTHTHRPALGAPILDRFARLDATDVPETERKALQTTLVTPHVGGDDVEEFSELQVTLVLGSQ